jgi:flagellar hook assembly protein FlgD
VLDIAVYNSAGEKVATISDSPVSNKLGDVNMTVNGEVSGILDPSEGNLKIILPGLQSETQPVNPGGAIFTWNGTTDAGQQVAPGLYYVKFTMQEEYGAVDTVVKSIQIIRSDTYTRISIYNSAGEVVYRVNLPVVQLSAISLAVDDVVTVGKGASTVQIGYAAGLMDTWDGMNDQGRIVDSGTYEVRVEVATGNNIDVAASKTITILNGGISGMISNIEIIPNPAVISDSTGSSVQIKWQASGTGKVDIQINNISGELITNISASLQAGSVYWNLQTKNGQNVAGGLYVLIIKAAGDNGETQIKVVKAVVVRK